MYFMEEVTKKDEPLYIQFLRESNAIEGVYDDVSLMQAIVAWQYLIRRKRMSVGIILKAHKTLMLHSKLAPNEKGYLRRCQVVVGGYEAPYWMQVPELMKEWCKDVMVRPHTLEAVKDMHVRFEKIHPFVDGNGRIGRMLLNWQICLQLGGVPMVIKESERHEYYKWFREPLPTDIAHHGAGSGCPIDMCSQCRAVDDANW